MSAEQRSVRNAVYTDQARLACQGGSRFTVGRDGSAHSAKDVSMGIAMSIDSSAFVYLKPVVPALLRKPAQVNLGTKKKTNRTLFFYVEVARPRGRSHPDGRNFHQDAIIVHLNLKTRVRARFDRL